MVAGDYGIELDGQVVAAVERKSLPDFVSTLTSGKLRYVLADLSVLERAAVVVEDRYSSVFKLDRVRPAVVAEGLAESQVRFPGVPIVFCENRKLAQEWTYRFLGAALAHVAEHRAAERTTAQLPLAGAAPPRDATPAEIREWARSVGLEVSDRGRIPADVHQRYEAAHEGRAGGKAGLRSGPEAVRRDRDAR